MASYLDQGMPENVRNVLAQLQQDAPPMSVELAEQVIEASSARPRTSCSVNGTRTPSPRRRSGRCIEQSPATVGRWRSRCSTPESPRPLRSDLATADVAFRGLAMLFPGLDPEPVVAELKERLTEELDYRSEADNQQAFAGYYRGHPHIHVPEVVPELSTGRVLTTELATGRASTRCSEWSQAERNLAAETIYRFAFGSIYRLGAFNGDPHPGNYLFRPGGGVTFLDFGLVKRFTRPTLDGFERMLTSIVLEPDPAQFRRSSKTSACFAMTPRSSDSEIVDYFSHFYEFVATPGPYTITEEYASATVRHIFEPGGRFAEIRKSANVPTDFVIIQRINLGLYAIFGQLNATGDWRRIAEEIWPWVDGPPSTRRWTRGKRLGPWSGLGLRARIP